MVVLVLVLLLVFCVFALGHPIFWAFICSATARDQLTDHDELDRQSLQKKSLAQMPSFKMSPTPFSFTFLACVLLCLKYFCVFTGAFHRLNWFLGRVHVSVAFAWYITSICDGHSVSITFLSWLKDAPRRTPQAAASKTEKKLYFTLVIYFTLLSVFYFTLLSL